MRYRAPTFLPAIIDRIIVNVICWWYRLRSPVLAFLWGVKCGRDVVFQGPTFLRTHGSSEIVIGNRVFFNSLFRTNLVGLMNPTVLDTRAGGHIEIGDDSGFSSVVVSSMSRIDIGCRVLVGGNVRIFDHDFHSVCSEHRCHGHDRENTKTKAVSIGDEVFIGTNVIILKGSKIGAGSVVSAGSVVFGLDAPPRSIIRGNPAVVVGSLKIS